MKKRKIQSYNALRGLCALGIFFSHMSYLGESNNNFWRYIYEYFMRHGSVCTTFFYISSGFLACYTWKQLSFKQYIKKKLQKIYPLAMIVLFLAVGLDIIFSGNGIINEGIQTGSRQWWFNILMNILMLKAFIPYESTFYSFHGPSWYLSGLIIFYFIAFFLVPKVIVENKDVRNRKRWIGGGICSMYHCIYH